MSSQDSQTVVDLPPGMDWMHIPTPGDHYSPSTGSAVMTVIYELTRCHQQAGGRTRVLVSEGTYEDHYSAGQVVKVPASQPASKPMKAADALLGRLGLPRCFSTRPYAPSIAGIEPGFEGLIFVHNGLQALVGLRKRAPKSQIWLYAHNDLLRTYSRVEAQRLLAHATGVVCVSNYIRKVTAEKAPAAADKLKVVLNGVDTETFAPATPSSKPGNLDPVILFVGRMVSQKGPHVLIKAAKHLADRGFNYKIRFVGSSGFTDKNPLSEYEQSLRTEAEGLGDRVEFLPFTPRHRIAQVYQSADIYVVSSTWDDPCPLIVLEAMGVGLPVVASRRGGIPEQGADAVGYFDPDQPEQLAQCLANLLGDSGRRQDAGRRCRQRALALAWEHRYQCLQEVCVAPDGSSLK